jgi:toxin ParE1/3/4
VYYAAELKNLRQWRIKGFTDFLIFYCPLPDGVEIVRVLHAKRNIAAILEDEEFQE